MTDRSLNLTQTLDGTMRELDEARAEVERLKEALRTVLVQANHGHAATKEGFGQATVYLAQGTFAHIRDTVQKALGT